MRLSREAIAGALLMVAGSSAAQVYPAKPVKMIMPYPAGGPTDILGRLISQKLAESWGQNIVIDNRPGGAGMIGGTLAAKSPPDGYTLYLGGITTLALARVIRVVSTLACIAGSRVSEAEINPLIVKEQGVVAVDGLVTPR